ncbi:MAG: hypothetical protein A4S09_13580 [Proteobacteria bacterium SG_bin7]|nr:MAG: hypothetical protein A4S09_13580 [Proteobacteria bacterium SG_bin7]
METQSSNFKTTSNDFRLLLQRELIERCRKNPKYSLRAFAKALGIVPSALSDMLNGKRTITPASIERLGLALGLELSEVKKYVKGQTPTADQNYQQLTMDTYAIISDWYHYAILELMKIKTFKSDRAWIARCLGITKSEVNAAFERLCRVDLIRVDKKGNWIDTSNGFSTNIENSNLTSAANKRLQKQILEMSIQALETLSPKVRNHTSMTMPVNPKKLPIAIEKIKKFRRDLCELLENDRDISEVYQLAISLFPITNTNIGEKI